MTTQAITVFSRIKRDYKSNVRRDPHTIPKFTPKYQSENLPFVELEAHGFLKKQTATAWVLTKKGQLEALK